MGKVKRIPVDDIQAMKKTLDALPDKHIGKTREQAADMLLANIQKAIAKGYTAKELAAIMGKGNVSMPAPLLRAKVLPPKGEKPPKPPKLEEMRKDEPPLTPEKTETLIVPKEPEQERTPPPKSPAVAKAQAILDASAPGTAHGGSFKVRPDTPNGEL
jgi:hypothetical protein